jgi:hypothetical protein
LKVVFATEEDSTKGISVSQLLKEEYDLDLQDTILAIATNIDLNKMHSLGEGKVGEALKKRIEAISVPLIMNADLRDHIPEFVARFAPFKFYSYASTRRFEDNLQISESAHAQFIEDLTYETKHLSNVSGRDLTMKMVNAINATLAAYEEETKLMLERNEIGKIIQALTIDVDNNGNFIVVPIERNHQNLGSSDVEYAGSHFNDTIKSYAIRGGNQ